MSRGFYKAVKEHVYNGAYAVLGFFKIITVAQVRRPVNKYRFHGLRYIFHVSDVFKKVVAVEELSEIFQYSLCYRKRGGEKFNVSGVVVIFFQKQRNK